MGAIRYRVASTPSAKVRAAAARALGQRTTTANGRGWYLTEALQLEGGLLVEGKPVTLDLVRDVLGTPNVDQLTAAPVDRNLQFLRYLVDPRKAEGKRLSFTVAVGGDKQLRRMELRNGVLVISDTDSKVGTHVNVSRRGLAEFILGLRPLAEGDAVVAELEGSLDRSQLMPQPGNTLGALNEPGKEEKYIVIGDH